MANQGSRKLLRRNRWADFVAAIILIGALVLGIFGLRDYVCGKMLNFASVSEGSITLTLPAELLVLRHEYVLHAPASGPFVAEVEEGARVKEGSLLGYCGGVAVHAPKGGAVSYELDGWEQALQIATLHELDWQQLFTVLREEQAATDEVGAAVEAEIQSAQRPVARLVDNLLDYTVLLKLKDSRGLLAEQQRVTFTIAGGKTISAAVQERWEALEGDAYYIYYIFNIPPKEDVLFSLRYSEAEVIAKEVRGIIVPSTAITVDEEGRVGVFIQKKRKLVFTEVEELTSQDDISVVSGLDKNAVVVTNPSRATNGQRI